MKSRVLLDVVVQLRERSSIQRDDVPQAAMLQILSIIIREGQGWRVGWTVLGKPFASGQRAAGKSPFSRGPIQPFYKPAANNWELAPVSALAG
jgi:hypothetical protein